jgi:Family of unknown function (DUF5677)
MHMILSPFRQITNTAHTPRQITALCYSLIVAENSGEAQVLAEAQVDAELYTESFLKQVPRAVKDRRKADRGFRSRLEKRWRRPFELYEGVLLLGLQLGSEFNQEESDAADCSDDSLFFALVRLQARSCLLCSEILALLQSGHASGAYGRWRTLHETAVTAWFISNGDQALAEKYLAHQVIKDLEDAEQYQKNCADLGSDLIPEADMEALRVRRDHLVKVHGQPFTGSYGWAADAVRSKIPETKGRSVNFNHLEQAAEQGHMRSYYRFASHSIHPTSKGLHYEIGLIRQGEVLLSGPSNYGLAEPANASCRSLHKTTGALLMTKPNRQRIASLTALENMIQLTSTAFIEAEQRIVKEDSEVQTGQFKSPTGRTKL